LHSIAWRLYHDANAQIGYVGHTIKFAQGKSRSARDYSRSVGLVIREDADALSEWRNSVGGGVVATGIEGALTGLGFNLLIIDDPVKDRESAESQLIRDKTYDWFTSVANTRLEPNGSIIVVHTRWHPDDLIGRLAAKEHDWTYINLKAIDDNGKPLWPEQWSLDELNKKRSQGGEYDWASLYQGDPRPRGGQLFKTPLRYDAPALDDARIIIAVDPAASEKNHADYSVAVVLAVRGYESDMRADVLEVIRGQWEIPKLCHELQILQKKWGSALCIEAQGVGMAVPQVLKSINPLLQIVEIKPKGDKYTRSQPIAAAWNEGRVRVPLHAYWLNDFLTEMGNFTGISDKHDDQVDAISHAWNQAAQEVGTSASYYSPLDGHQVDLIDAAMQRRIDEICN